MTAQHCVHVNPTPADMPGQPLAWERPRVCPKLDRLAYMHMRSIWDRPDATKSQHCEKVYWLVPRDWAHGVATTVGRGVTPYNLHVLLHDSNYLAVKMYLGYTAVGYHAGARDSAVHVRCMFATGSLFVRYMLHSCHCQQEKTVQLLGHTVVSLSLFRVMVALLGVLNHLEAFLV